MPAHPFVVQHCHVNQTHQMRNGMIDNMQCANAPDQLQNDLMVQMWTNWNVNNMEDSEESDSDSGND